MKVLVTGGAGYVGSVVVEGLLKEGHAVMVVDNLSQGHKEAVLPDALFARVDICHAEALGKVFSQFKPEAVVHMAAETIVEHSMSNPGRYFQTNIQGSLNILNAMLQNDVKTIIYSSTAAVYGEPQYNPIDEEHPKNPINSYGETKLMFGRMLHWYQRAYGMKYITFRYFCAAGATGRVGEHHTPETHLIPNVLRAALNHQPVNIYGTDYPTEDGTCVRDFLHVEDIARAHILALSKINNLGVCVFNLGNHRGYSVREVIKTAERVTGRKITFREEARRQGDPTVLVASAERANKQLGWQPQYPALEQIVESAWKWHRKHPKGYGK